MALSRVGEPRERGPKAPFIRRLKPQETYHAIVLCREPFCCYTHWLPKIQATMPCLSHRDQDGTVIDDTDCEYCQQRMPERWRAYIHVWAGQVEREEFLELTWRCWSAAKAFLPLGFVLRGWQLQARKDKGVKTKTHVRLEPPGRGMDADRLPPEKTPEKAFENTMIL